MSLFRVIEDAQIILRNRGVYKQVKLYDRGGRLYAQWGSGFIVLLASGNTSHPNVVWEDMPEWVNYRVTGFYLERFTPRTITKVA